MLQMRGFAAVFVSLVVCLGVFLVNPRHHRKGPKSVARSKRSGERGVTVLPFPSYPTVMAMASRTALQQLYGLGFRCGVFADISEFQPHCYLGQKSAALLLRLSGLCIRFKSNLGFMYKGRGVMVVRAGGCKAEWARDQEPAD